MHNTPVEMFPPRSNFLTFNLSQDPVLLKSVLLRAHGARHLRRPCETLDKRLVCTWTQKKRYNQKSMIHLATFDYGASCVAN